MVGRVEEMGKEPFLVFAEPEGFGKSGHRHLEETERVFEHNVAMIDGHGQEFGAIHDLFRDHVLLVDFIQDQVGIKAVRVVS